MSTNGLIEKYINGRKERFKKNRKECNRDY